MRHPIGFLFLCLVLGLLGSGCTKEIPLIPVTGKVTMKGKALANVQVEFHPDPDQKNSGPTSTGTTDKEGNFTLVSSSPGNKPGAVAGHHRVILKDLDIYGNVFVGRGDYRSEDPKGPKEVPKIPRFPEQHSNLANTPHHHEVKTGMGPVVIEIK